MKPHVLLISGSLNTPSRTRALMDVVKVVLERKGVSAEMWDLQEKPVPICNPAYHYNPEQYPDAAVRELVAAAERADGFVLGSPVYHNSFSGVLKNALDHLTMDHFWNKPVGLVAAGGRQRSVQPVDQLRIVVRGLHGLCIPYQVVGATDDFTETNGVLKLNNADVLRRMGDFADELMEFLKMKQKV